jgi:hypothetical protein
VGRADAAPRRADPAARLHGVPTRRSVLRTRSCARAGRDLVFA